MPMNTPLPPRTLQVVSGGEEGMVRVWRIGRDSQVLEASMKDHKGSVNSITIKASGGWGWGWG